MGAEMIDQDFIDQLVEQRKARGLTQATVARRMNCCTSNVGKFETKANIAKYSPTLATVLRYAAAIGVTIGITGAADK